MAEVLLKSLKKDYYGLIYCLLEASIHQSNLRYIKYELDFDDTSEEALEMFKLTFYPKNFDKEVEKGTPEYTEARKKLMMALNASYKKLKKLIGEINVEGEKYNIPPINKVDECINFLTFSPRGIVNDAGTPIFNKKVKERVSVDFDASYNIQRTIFAYANYADVIFDKKEYFGILCRKAPIFVMGINNLTKIL